MNKECSHAHCGRFSPITTPIAFEPIIFLTNTTPVL